MAKEVILMDDVDGLGDTGDIVRVADGYARNYLLPRKLAQAVTPAARRMVEKRKIAAESKRASLRSAAEELAAKIGATTVTIKVKTGVDGKLFGSVTTTDVAEALKKQSGIDLPRQQIDLHQAIKELGEQAVPVRLYKDVKASLKISVVQE
jgi:large subunit ribosomal protein L9